MEDIIINDELYRDYEETESKEVVTESESITIEIDEELVEKVKRIVIKGQIDGS